ncbi:unnamed protein product [Wuchereria bancrofti]|uniref:Uncharacterized protein n=1 Tax=Wuchereria bancrofti TaxID=6293 RepID=A0A3P7EKC8_WUCBA|nr:unnamed protein product [Wuchereria bancrofti]
MLKVVNSMSSQVVINCQPSVYLDYDRMVTHGRIPSYRFVIPSTVYDPFLPENKGFCNPKTPRYFSNDIQPGQFSTRN